ncbi:MAG: hypothetical protein JXA60_01965 [Candidatus Coatesbacteria bacterium]|nr:hypothetical protein [Candidatus Coatesbacteria bacterium]
MKILTTIAELMAVSAVTAPKTRGEDYISIKIIDDEDEIRNLAEKMVEYGEKTNRTNFDRDAKGVLKSSAIVLIGLKDAPPALINCGACGFPTCAEALKVKQENEFKGLICAFRLIDLGIALGSAVKTAMNHNIDNRIMYRVGAVARNMGMVDWDIVMGIPLSATGKNIFFDR